MSNEYPSFPDTVPLTEADDEAFEQQGECAAGPFVPYDEPVRDDERGLVSMLGSLGFSVAVVGAIAAIAVYAPPAPWLR